MINKKVEENTKLTLLYNEIKNKYHFELQYGFECKPSINGKLIDENYINISKYGVFFFVDEDINLIYNIMSKRSAYISRIIQDINNNNPSNISYTNTYKAISTSFYNGKKIYLYYIEIEPNQMSKELIKNLKVLCCDILVNR